MHMSDVCACTKSVKSKSGFEKSGNKVSFEPVVYERAPMRQGYLVSKMLGYYFDH
jgi:hypothetical protein